MGDTSVPKLDETKILRDFLSQNQLISRKQNQLSHASAAEQNYRNAVLQAAAELSHEYSAHYWPEVLMDGRNPLEKGDQPNSNNPSTDEAIKNGFISHLNANGKYLVIREQLRGAIGSLIQQKCSNCRPCGFHSHQDFQAYLHDIYVYLMDETHEILNSATLQETDPLKLSRDRVHADPFFEYRTKVLKSFPTPTTNQRSATVAGPSLKKNHAKKLTNTVPPLTKAPNKYNNIYIGPYSGSDSDGEVQNI